MRLGFRLIKGFRAAHAERIVAARKAHGAFTSIDQFRRVTRLPVTAIRLLAEADAFESLGLSRRQALWQALALKDDRAPLFEPEDEAEAATDAGEPLPANLPAMPIAREVMADYATAGLSLKRHPVALCRAELTRRKVLPAEAMYQRPHGTWVKVAGLVLIRQRPGTASGIVFATIEDETGVANLILTPDVYERYRLAARHAALLQADGYLERHGQVVHVLAKRLFALDELLWENENHFRSRDFH